MFALVPERELIYGCVMAIAVVERWAREGRIAAELGENEFTYAQLSDESKRVASGLATCEQSTMLFFFFRDDTIDRSKVLRGFSDPS